MAGLVGRVTWRDEDGAVTVTLRRGGKLKCSRPGLGKILRAELDNYRRGYSPADGPFGCRWLADLAKAVKGAVKFPPERPAAADKEQRVY